MPLPAVEEGMAGETASIVKPAAGRRWLLVTLLTVVVLLGGCISLGAYFMQKQRKELHGLSQELEKIKFDLEEAHLLAIQAEQGVQRLRVDLGAQMSGLTANQTPADDISWSRQQRQVSGMVSQIHLAAKVVRLPRPTSPQADCEDDFFSPRQDVTSPGSIRKSYDSLEECKSACLDHTPMCFGIQFSSSSQPNGRCRFHIQSSFSRQSRVQQGTVQYIRQCCGNTWHPIPEAHGYISKQGFQPNHTDAEYRHWEPTYYPDQRSSALQFSEDTGRVHVTEAGLYLIYTQIVYYNGGPISGHMVVKTGQGEETVLTRCVQHTSPSENNSDTCADQVARYFTCSTTTTHRLQAGDVMVMKAMWADRTVKFKKDYCFWGVVKLSVS